MNGEVDQWRFEKGTMGMSMGVWLGLQVGV
jgi:hypothetical protein